MLRHAGRAAEGRGGLLERGVRDPQVPGGAGGQKYIYHRPAHGAGWEGHQLPELSLGDYTMLVKGMCFSEEPGLFDPEGGCGFNWSDTVVTAVKSGYRMSMVPYTKEWCFLKL